MRAALLLGVLDGLLIALLAVGVVLVYRADRFVNLANAQLGILSSLLLARLVADLGVDWYVAFVSCTAIGVAVGAGCRHVILARLESATRTSLMIATLGVSQLLLALAFVDWIGPDPGGISADGYPLPFRARVEFDGLVLDAGHVLVAVIVPVLLASLVWWLRLSAFGRTLRAAAGNPTAARLAGIDVRRTSTVAWAIAGGMSAIGAILSSPGQAVLELQRSGPLLLLLSLGAAALAGLTSLRGAVAAGLALGMIDHLAVHVGRSGGAGVAAVFAAVLLGLFVRSRVVGPAEAVSVNVERSVVPLRIPPEIAGHWLVRHGRLLGFVAAVVMATTLAFLPWFGQPHRTFALGQAAVFAVVALSLTILAGWGGQVSLGQLAFVGIGAFTAARLAPRGWSLAALMLAAALVGAATAVAVAAPAVRSRGYTLAITTLGLAVVGPAWLYQQRWFAPAGTTSVDAAYQLGLGRLGTQRSVYLTAVALLAVAGVAIDRLRRSNIGRAVVAVRDNEPAAAMYGLSPVRLRLLTAAGSGALAAMAGVLWLAVNRTVSSQVLDPDQSLLALSAVVVGGLGSVGGAVIGAVAFFGFPLLFADALRSVVGNTLQLQFALSGSGLLLTQLFHPNGIAGTMRDRRQGVLDRLASRTEAASQADSIAPPAPAPERSSRPAPTHLVVRDVTVDFGSGAVVDRVSIDVAPGEIVGVIGANGAGKTTLLDAICGLVPAEGTVRLGGVDISSRPAAGRATSGMSRGFQDARLFPALTVRETLELSLHQNYPSSAIGVVTRAPWERAGDEWRAREADEVMGRFGLLDYADVPTDRLSTGTRHLADLAAQAARRPALMILDEPTSGIATKETEALAPVVRGLAADIGCAVLIVEHDLAFLDTVADRIYRLDQGRVIDEAIPRRSPARRRRQPLRAAGRVVAEAGT